MYQVIISDYDARGRNYKQTFPSLAQAQEAVQVYFKSLPAPFANIKVSIQDLSEVKTPYYPLPD